MGRSIRWTTKVPKGPDISLRSYLAWQGMKKFGLTNYFERIVSGLVLVKTVNEVHAHNVYSSDEEIDVAINEAMRR